MADAAPDATECPMPSDRYGSTKGAWATKKGLVDPNESQDIE